MPLHEPGRRRAPQPERAAQGIWRLALFNPLRSYSVAFNLTVSKHATCLNDCSGRGQCSQVRPVALRTSPVLATALPLRSPRSSVACNRLQARHVP